MSSCASSEESEWREYECELNQWRVQVASCIRKLWCKVAIVGCNIEDVLVG